MMRPPEPLAAGGFPLLRATPTAALVAALLLVPLATASPLEGRLDRADGLLLSGSLVATAERGILDLSEAARRGAAVPLRALSFDGVVVTEHTRDVKPLWNDRDPTRPDDERALSGGEVAVEVLGCAHADCVVALVADGDGAVGLAATGAGGLRALALDAAFCGWACDPARFRAVAPAGSLALDALGEGWSPTGLRAEGDVTLFARGATVRLRDARGVETLDLAPRETPETPAPGGPTRTEWPYLVLRLGGVQAAGEAPATLLSEAPTLALRGVMESPLASGVLAFAGERRAFERERVAIDGDVAYGVSPDGAARVVGGVAAPPVASTVEGDARSLTIGDATMRAPSAPVEASARDVAAGVGLAALLAAALGLLSRAGGLFLYSRIRTSQLLENANRKRVFEEIRARGAPTASELSRVLGLARVTTLHHLRMLEAHQLVASRAMGARRSYFLVERAPTPASFARAIALDDPTRRRIAEVLDRLGPATQREICEATGLTQRLVSHHLARLSTAGVVEARGSLPKRYARVPEPAQARS